MRPFIPVFSPAAFAETMGLNLFAAEKDNFSR